MRGGVLVGRENYLPGNNLPEAGLTDGNEPGVRMAVWVETWLDGLVSPALTRGGISCSVGGGGASRTSGSSALANARGVS